MGFFYWKFGIKRLFSTQTLLLRLARKCLINCLLHDNLLFLDVLGFEWQTISCVKWCLHMHFPKLFNAQSWFLNYLSWLHELQIKATNEVCTLERIDTMTQRRWKDFWLREMYRVHEQGMAQYSKIQQFISSFIFLKYIKLIHLTQWRIEHMAQLCCPTIFFLAIGEARQPTNQLYNTTK
jgi:hypothetical protein